jgi:cell wall-associated NlpC family hydrolase
VWNQLPSGRLRRQPVLVVLSLLALVACGSDAAKQSVGPDPSPAPTTIPGNQAWIDVAVANMWAAPDQVRPLDAPSLAKPVDMDAWLASMSTEDRLWLVGRLVTQALYGDPVTIVESAGDWTRVVAPRQPSSLDPRGYPGWLPTAQLTATPPATGTGATAVVTRPASTLRDLDDPEQTVMELSFNTRLPVLASDPTGVTVATPNGGRGRLARTDVSIDDTPPTATGEEVVRTAQQFAGVAYLWGGTSGPAWDCSGLTSAVYAVHGVVIPRDADDQAAAGSPVDKDDLRPGDLLFYATGPDRESIHHVGIYVGEGRMIQAPATGRTVETVPIDRPGLASEFWGARRYLQSG